jgi:hypothetical protein
MLRLLFSPDCFQQSRRLASPTEPYSEERSFGTQIHADTHRYTRIHRTQMTAQSLLVELLSSCATEAIEEIILSDSCGDEVAKPKGTLQRGAESAQLTPRHPNTPSTGATKAKVEEVRSRSNPARGRRRRSAKAASNGAPRRASCASSPNSEADVEQLLEVGAFPDYVISHKLSCH